MEAHAVLLSVIIVMMGSYFISASHPDCEGSGGMDPDNDASRITAEQGTSRKGRRNKVSDIEKAQIRWDPDDLGKYDLSSLKLAYRSNGEWNYNTASKYNGHYVWSVARKPCLKYEYQVIVPLKGENGTFCTQKATLEEEDKDTIRNAHVECAKDETIEVVTNNEKSTEANDQVTNSNVGEEGGSGTIIAVVIVLIVVVAGGVGYWLINKKKTSGGASLESGPEVKKEYSEVPTNENDANKIEKEKVADENDTNKIEIEKP